MCIRDRRRALPAEVWRRNEKMTMHGFFSDKEILSVTADPDQGYADVDRTNNTIRKPVTPRPIS